MFKRIVVVVCAVVAFGCGSSNSTPAAPSSPQTPTTTTTSTKIIALGGSLAFGTVPVGNKSTLAFTIANTGNAALTVSGITITNSLAVFLASWTSGTIAASGSQTVTIQFAPTAAQPYAGTITVNGDQTSGTNTIAVSGIGTSTATTPTIPSGPQTQFGNGQFLVGTQIAAGRYYVAPASGCYWERESGTGGTFSEIIANDFIGFSAAQWIVDILSSDRAFKSDSCGTWFKDSPRQGAQTTISRGMWLVGSQVSAGTYSASVQSGCYWERLSNFQGSLSGIIANNFISSAGSALVTISQGDAGFDTNDKCGTWTRTTGTALTVREQSSSDIEGQRMLAGRMRFR